MTNSTHLTKSEECLWTPADHEAFLSVTTTLLKGCGLNQNEIIQQADECVRKLKEDRAGFNRSASGENARRRLQNARLRTPIPTDRIVGLTAAKLDLEEVIAKLLGEILPKVIKLAFIESELADAKALQAKLEAGRQELVKTGIYPQTLDFVNGLFRDFNVTHANFAAMTPEEIQEIARILRRKPDLLPRDEPL